MAPKDPLQCKRCQRFGHTQHNCGYAPRCVACGGFHLSGGCATLREQPQCCGCGGNYMAHYRAVLSGKKRREPLQSRRPSRAERAPPQATLSLRKFSGTGPLLGRWTWASGGATLPDGDVSRLPTIGPKIQIPHLNRSRSCPSSLK